MWIKKYNFTLLELMIYLAAFLVVSSLAFSLFFSGFDRGKKIREAAEDINRVASFGDRWRCAIRKAEEVKLDKERLVLYKSGKPFLYYELFNGGIWKSFESSKYWYLVLDGVKSCRFKSRKKSDFSVCSIDNTEIIESSDNENIWQVEIELKSRIKNGKIKPLFCFVAVLENPVMLVPGE